LHIERAGCRAIGKKSFFFLGRKKIWPADQPHYWRIFRSAHITACQNHEPLFMIFLEDQFWSSSGLFFSSFFFIETEERRIDAKF